LGASIKDVLNGDGPKTAFSFLDVLLHPPKSDAPRKTTNSRGENGHMRDDGLEVQEWARGRIERADLRSDAARGFHRPIGDFNVEISNPRSEI
jgi:hypothetical protein